MSNMSVEEEKEINDNEQTIWIIRSHVEQLENQIDR